MEEERSCLMLDKCNPKTNYFCDTASIKQQAPPFYLLSVRIIRLRNLRQADIFTKSDCYINLRLPTACFGDVRTKTVSDSSNPVWNETFYFRIQPIVKNVLELRVCDEDGPLGDELLCTVLFDIAHLQPGETVCKHFELNEQKDELLEVEFTLEQMPDIPENVISNGVLVVCDPVILIFNIGRIFVLENVVVNNQAGKRLTFTVKGSHENTQDIVLDSRARCVPPGAIMFNYAKYCCPEMEVVSSKKRSFCNFSGDERSNSLFFPLLHLPMGERVEITNNKAYNIRVTAENCQKDLDVRLGFGLCPEEQDFICKRKKYVAAALKNVLNLKEDLQDDEVPIVAVMTTAGGIRSMTAMYGSLLGLQKLNLLDCISYVTGLSGTTWTMINLYGDANWTKRNLEETISDVRKHVMKNKLCCFSGEKLKYYEKEMCQRYKEGHKVSFSDLWGLILESMLTDEPDPQKLSDQQQAINMGQNPLPIYLGLNMRKRYSTLDFKEWMECTPYEVGFMKYGAFIKAESFGSEFFMGRMMKKIPESRLSYLQGMWSNIFSPNVLDAFYLANCSEDFWHRWTRDRITDTDEDIPPIVQRRLYAQSTNIYVPSGTLTNVLRDVITLRPVLAHYYNFMKGLQLNNKYFENDTFCSWKDTVLDSAPNQLADTPEYLELVDTACFINTSCPPLLRPERKVDVILHLNYSGGSQLLPLDLSTKYYAEQGIPFPKVVLTEEDRKHLKECYVFDEVENPKAPILVYMPLVCDTFQKYKAPGMERSPSEMEEGQADVTNTIFSPYATGMIQYSEANFNKLVNLTNYNILNNEHLILQALRTAIERKKQQKSLFPSS